MGKETPPSVGGCKFFVTAQMMKQIAPQLTDGRATRIAVLCNTICPDYGITTADIFHEFIATCAVESGGFLHKDENMNYSANRQLQIFPKYFTAKTAAVYARKPEQIANLVYANRMGNGDVKSGDGWRNRGGGFIQMTGEDMFRAYAAYKKMKVEEVANLVRIDDQYAMDSACWIFSVVKGLIDEAIADEVVTIRKRINGGTHGMSEYLAYLERAKKAIS